MIKATLGFVFNQKLSKVLLITKHRPEYIAGLVNALGGKCETGESPVQCVAREVYEESSLKIPQKSWRKVAVMKDGTWHIFVYAAVYDGQESEAITTTDEPIEWYPADELPADIVSNLSWLVPVAKDILTKQGLLPFLSVKYSPNPSG